MVPLSEDLGGIAGCPKEAYSNFMNLKHGLLILALNTLNTLERDKKNPTDCGDVMNEKLKNAGMSVEEKTGKVIPFGFIRGYAFGKPKGTKDLLVLHTTITVICGVDESIYLFRKIQGKWKLILAQEAVEDKFSTQENLRYLIFESKEKPIMVLTHTPLWCQSCWISMSLSVLQPGTDPFKPKIILSDEKYVYRCADMKLEKTKMGFTLNYTGEDKDPGVVLKKVTEPYSLAENGVKRIEK